MCPKRPLTCKCAAARGGWTSCYPDHLEIKTIVKIVSKLKISEEILQIRYPMCIVWLYTITSTRNPTNTSPICIVWLYTITSTNTRNPTNTSPICIVWLYTITSTNTRNPTNTVINMYCMTLHDNKHKKSYKYVTNMYCMTLHDNKHKHKKSYKYGHQYVLYDFTR